MLFKNKFFALLLTLVLTVSSFSICAFAADVSDDTNDLVGEGSVEEVTFKITVPSDLAFAIDPFELTASATSGVTNSQIVGGDYAFLNKTQAPVKIGFDFTVTDESSDTTEDVTLVANPETDLSPDDDTVKDKKAYLAVIGAASIADETATDITYDIAEDGTLVPFSTDGEASTAFVLAKSVDGTNVASGTTGVASFTFYGVLNTYADWQDKDIVISADYTLTALRPATYTKLDTDSKGVNQLPASASAEPGFPGDTSEAQVFTKASPADLTYTFNAAGGTIALADVTTSWTLGTDYTYNAATNTLVLKKEKIVSRWGASAAGAKSATITVTGGSAPGEYTLNITLA